MNVTTMLLKKETVDSQRCTRTLTHELDIWYLLDWFSDSNMMKWERICVVIYFPRLWVSFFVVLSSLFVGRRFLVLWIYNRSIDRIADTFGTFFLGVVRCLHSVIFHLSIYLFYKIARCDPSAETPQQPHPTFYHNPQYR